MIKVITYGTFDLLHFGHINLLKRAKELGDYLIVGVTADDFDKTRGKINVQQTLIERIEAVKETGLADEIIVEEYEGQKIDDIKRLEVDIFAIGSDWKSKFDYLSEFCQVIYLDRTTGVSSSELRSKNRKIRLGIVGETNVIEKFVRESSFVNGVEVIGIYTEDKECISSDLKEALWMTNDYDKLLDVVDAVYIISHPSKHYDQIKKAICKNKNVLCESPLSMRKTECNELFDLAKKNNCILMESLKTAYATAYSRLLLLAKSEIIGSITSVDTTCTSLRKINMDGSNKQIWNSICAWGPTAMLPIFQILGTEYLSKTIISKVLDENNDFDVFTKINFVYKQAVASITVGKGVKSEGDMVISGTKGYIYVPAPWWKTDYFEVRYEKQENNKRYFYQLEGEGIRYELVAFIKAIETQKSTSYIDEEISVEFSSIIEDFNCGKFIKI